MASLSTSIILKALDCLSTRAAVSAQNIANAGTPGYRPLFVSFENALASAASKGPAAVLAVQARLERQSASGAGLRLDLEVANASATAMRYAALIEVLNHRMQRDALALSGNG
jgi:flagellar basal-body rod protein FlgB